MNGDSQSMGPEEKGGPFVAGWMDGNHAGRCSVLRTFRRTAAAFELTCDEKGRLFSRSEAGSQPETASPPRDNPEGDPSYDRGFDRGFAEVVGRLTRELVGQAVPLGLFVARGGFVMTLDRAQDLVGAGVPRLPTSADLSDEALHAFLDGDLTGPTEASATVAPRGASAAGEEPRGAAEGRAWRLDRRSLVGLGVGAALSGTLMQLFGGGLLRTRGSMSASGATTKAQTGGSYVPPTWWDDLPPTSRTFFLTWDQLVWNLEQTSTGTDDLHAALQTFMLTPGYEELKRNVAGFLEDSRRVDYHWDLLHALVPGVSSPEVHGMVFACIASHITEFGPSIVSPQVASGLQLYRDQGLAPNASCAEVVTRVLSMLGL